jgi:hypothetical protein
MTYVASVTFEGKIQIIERDDYKTKKAFAHDLRANGYRVRLISTPEKFNEDAEKYNKRREDHNKARRIANALR